eukprot:scaffold2660_cov257-Pinguiococcus_pyrenoidosus.AAC.2
MLVFTSGGAPAVSASLLNGGRTRGERRAKGALRTLWRLSNAPRRAGGVPSVVRIAPLQHRDVAAHAHDRHHVHPIAHHGTVRALAAAFQRGQGPRRPLRRAHGPIGALRASACRSSLAVALPLAAAPRRRREAHEGSDKLWRERPGKRGKRRRS